MNIKSAVRVRGSRLALAALLTAAIAAAYVFLAAGSAAPRATAADDPCPNAEFRTGPSAKLPDCRAYELASPLHARAYISSTNPPEASYTQAATTGDRIAWFSFYPQPGSPADGFHYLSTRGSSGWSTDAVTPPTTQDSAPTTRCQPGVSFSPDLSRGVVNAGYSDQDEDLTCGDPAPALVAGAPEGTKNLYLRDSDTGIHQLVRVTSAGDPPTGAELGEHVGNATFQNASDDFSKIVFGDTASLTPASPNGPTEPDRLALYLWSEDEAAVSLVSVLPDGTPVSGHIANATGHSGPGFGSVLDGAFAGTAPFTGAVSSDGSRVFFQTGGNLYLRENADQPQSPIAGGVCTDETAACTVHVDASQGSGPGGAGEFKWASDDGARVFFTAPATAGLTPDTAPGSGQNLYLYDVDAGVLTNLTPGGDARVRGLSGVSADGSHAYFVADGVLAPGAAVGQPNLYLLQEGTPTFIATLSPSDAGDWSSVDLTARVSPNGRYVAFNSVNSLTGYDNTDPGSGQPTTQIFLYDADTADLRCASCDPNGAPPVGSTVLQPPLHQQVGGGGPAHLQRNLLDNGRLFFSSRNPLVPEAGNGRSNVYQLAPDGAGSCEDPAGCLDLISTGNSSHGSFFYDASTSGDDVFFVTSQDLLGGGSEGAMAVYDARVGGGFPQPSPPPEPCAGDACKGDPTSAPADPNPGSAAGIGNQGKDRGSEGFTQAKKAKKCKKKKKKKCKKKGKKKGKKSVNRNSGGAK